MKSYKLIAILIILIMLCTSCNLEVQSEIQEVINDQINNDNKEEAQDQIEADHEGHDHSKISSEVENYLLQNYNVIMPGVNFESSNKVVETVEFNALSSYNQITIDEEQENNLSLVKGFLTIKHFYTDNYIDSWENYLQNSFNVKVTLVQRDFTDRDIVAFARELEGIITLLSIDELLLLREANLLQPLNEYINSSQEMNYYSKNAFIPYTGFDGNIWAFPNTNSNSQNIRIYRKDSIDNTIGYVPNDLNSFYEYCSLVSSDDFDENGKNDTYSIFVDSGYDYSSFIDIFRAYNIFVSRGSAIQYSPINEKFEVAFLHSNIEETLNYIISLKQMDSIKTVNDINVGDVFTSRYLLSHLARTDQYYGGFYLEGYNTRFLIEENPASNYYALLNKTSDQKEMFDTFVEKFLFSFEGNLALSYGIPNISYKIIENKLLNEKIIVTKSNDIHSEVNNSTVIPIHFYCSTYTGELKKCSDEVYEEDYKKIQTYFNYYKNESNNFINLTYSLGLDTRKTFDPEFDELSFFTMKNLLLENVNASDTIDFYINEFNKLGGREMIDEANAKLRKP